MPQNKSLKVICNHTDCYWYLKYKGQNCASSYATITDDECQQYIEKENALKRFAQTSLELNAERFKEVEQIIARNS
ncbi:MAG: hypothetical protein WC389_12865 [Lutibacter sp.]|jgi:hypothetical protein